MESISNIELTDEQIFALMDIENWWHKQDKQVLEITGGPGTGKTFLVKYFADRIGLTDDDILYIAFSGKAVSVMARNGLPAKTIHSSIYNYQEVYAKDENGHVIMKENGKPKKTFEFVLKEKLSKKYKLIVIDEGSMVGERVAKDILTFGLPIICLGDLNQLPPVMDKSFFLKDPDIRLTKIMRQKEGDPIVWLSEQVLAGRELKYGVYGNSAVIRKNDVTEYMLKNVDIIITGTNSLRNEINKQFRSTIKKLSNLEFPYIGEKVVCVKNNWNISIDNGVFLTNGTTGFIDNVYRSTYNKYSIMIDFRPDFTKSVFKNLRVDYNHLMGLTEKEESKFDMSKFLNSFEFGYAITTHKAQGGGWGSVMFMAENFFRNSTDRKRFLYTGITRAIDQVIIVQ